MQWFALGFSIFLLLAIAQYNLYVAMFSAALSLGLLSLPVNEFIGQVYLTFTDPSIVSLAVVVAVIAMIGGILEESGGMEKLVANMRIGKRPFLAFSPALLGMLPMPGGALLSAPMVESSGKELTNSTKVAVNVWFRHILFFIYPLAPSLIASAKIANLEVYNALPYLFPFFLLSLLVGYYFFLRKTSEPMNYESAFSLQGLLIPLGIILTAPLLDFLLKTLWNPAVGEYATLIGVMVSISLAILRSGYSLRDLLNVAKKMEPWGFALIIFAMFTFLNVFQASGSPELLAQLNVPLSVLLIAIGFILGIITGRIQVPVSIVIPIFLARAGMGTMPLVLFAVTYFSVFLGYAISPIHPCVSVSIEFFDTSMRQYLLKMGAPIAISLAAAAGAYFYLG